MLGAANLWVFWAVLASIAYAAYNFLFKLGSSENIFLFLTAANLTAFVVYILVLLFGFDKEIILADLLQNKALIWGFMTGLMIAAFEITFIYMLQNTATGLSIGNALIGILSLLLTALAGILVFKEVITWQNALGIAFGLLSVWLLTYKSS